MVSRNMGNEIPKELLRQSGRINEQYSNLQMILNNVAHWLEEMGNLVKRYDPYLQNNMNSLKYSVEVYLRKSKDIYNNLSTGLEEYAHGLEENLENLSDKVVSISKSVDDL